MSMRITAVDDIKPGEKAALDIHDAGGRQLVKKGAEFTEAIKCKLKFHDISFAYTEGGELSVNRVFDPNITAELLRVTRHFAESGGTDSGILRVYNTEEIRMFAAYSREPAAKMAFGHIFMFFSQKMAGCLKGTENLFYDFLDFRSLNTYPAYHAVNSACIALLIGREMGLSGKDLAGLCAGMLMADSKMSIYGFALKNGQLAENEKEEVKQHVLLAFEEAKKMYGVPARAAAVIASHHERADGSGYPKGIKGGNTGATGRIAAVADVYDALLSERPYRKAFFPDKAWEYVAANKGVLFDAETVKAFMNVTAKYIPGDIVELNDKRRACVTANTAGKMTTPVIKIIEKKGKSDIISDTAIDLSGEKGTIIARTLKSARREE